MNKMSAKFVNIKTKQLSNVETIQLNECQLFQEKDLDTLFTSFKLEFVRWN